MNIIFDFHFKPSPAPIVSRDQNRGPECDGWLKLWIKSFLTRGAARMSEEAIVKKLRRQLQRKIVSECQVVYVLVEIRKLLALHNQAGSFSILNLYCNWTVHTS